MAGFGSLAGSGGGISGGTAGPAQSSATSRNVFNVGGNTGIGSSQGVNATLLIVLSVAAISAFFLLSRR